MFQQAENRLHVQKALILYLLADFRHTETVRHSMRGVDPVRLG